MKLEKNNKYSGKKILTTLSMTLLTSTLLMGCSSVHAEEAPVLPQTTPTISAEITQKPMVTPTPIIEPTATPTTLPSRTREEEIEALNITTEYRMSQKCDTYAIRAIIYTVNDTCKIAFVWGGGDRIICTSFNYFDHTPMFQIPFVEIIGIKTSEIDLTKYSCLCYEESDKVEVISSDSVKSLEQNLDKLGIEHGKSQYSETMPKLVTQYVTLEELANYYLDVVPEPNRVYPSDLIIENENKTKIK